MRSKPVLVSVFVLACGAAAGASAQPGAVYAATNSFAGNAIVVYDRAEDGTLTLAGTFPTGGQGTGLQVTRPGGKVDPLASQDSVILSRNGRFLFAVNAGSDELSSFRVEPHGLTLIGKVASGGVLPVSLAPYGDLLYVLTIGGVGGGANVTGFTINRRGRLLPLAGSTRTLKTGGSGQTFLNDSPSQVAFTATGEGLVVLDKGRNRFLSFAIGGDGLPSAKPVVSSTVGTLPFAFVLGPRGSFLSVEIFAKGTTGGPAGASGASSYYRGADGRLQPLTSSLPDRQTASCWIAWDGGEYAYTTNTGGDTLTGFRIDRTGRMSLLDPSGLTYAYPRGTAPLDVGLSRDGRFLYTLNGGTGTVSAFRIELDGHLTSLGEVGGLPVGDTEGLAVR